MGKIQANQGGKQKMNLKKQEGITLTILVITILVILLIVGASVGTILSRQGLLKSAQEAQQSQQNAAAKEEEKTNDLIDSVGSSGTGISAINLDESVNSPKLKEGMIPVKWQNGSWVVTDSSDENWYNYRGKQWANVMLTDGLTVEGIMDVTTATMQEMKGKRVTSVGSMFVWIPRYAYKITQNYHKGGDSITGTVDICFLKEATNNPIKEGPVIVEYNAGTTQNYTSFPDGYVVHPAFQYEQSVTGIWVAKFEASHTGCTTSENTGSENTNVTTKTLQVKPGVTSWRNIQIGTSYSVCLNYMPTLNSHLMKNTEWGAVAYLSQSGYGKNSEIWINNSGSYITGSAGNTAISSQNTGVDTNYASEQGMQASSTGNVTGIYDLAGGAWEYTASYLENGYVKEPGTDGAISNNNRYTYGDVLIKGANKTKFNYAVASSEDATSNYGANKDKYGDAIYEVSSNSISNWDDSWNAEFSQFPSTQIPFMIRGGDYGSSSLAGPYAFNANSGEPATNCSFRPVLVVL